MKKRKRKSCFDCWKVEETRRCIFPQVSEKKSSEEEVKMGMNTSLQSKIFSPSLFWSCLVCIIFFKGFYDPFSRWSWV